MGLVYKKESLINWIKIIVIIASQTVQVGKNIGVIIIKKVNLIDIGGNHSLKATIKLTALSAR